ncbi:putative cupredoxin [Rosa chinensis]|uniref:Putative cupredoxin n=1 Tax=Rosa chinensis TaxID=74649 RepID=A0A2P6S601_ROSCH|nr:mavicyanin [Rosa chinensis]PRQ54098.1 putative cupredoxin [Rosa chinensis]
MAAFKTSLFWLVIFISLGNSLVFSAFEFQVGGTQGWIVPPTNDSKVYNDWASENRFQIGNAIRFKYKKDSVMEVTEEDYKKCNSSHPNFFSNNGNTVYRFDHSGSFYFISGAAGHCEKGQRMIVKVMSTDEESPLGKKSAGYRAAVYELGVSKLVFVQFVLFYVASLVF